MANATIATGEGWVTCPVCGYKKLKRVHPDEEAARVYIHCPRCKHDIPMALAPQCAAGDGSVQHG